MIAVAAVHLSFVYVGLSASQLVRITSACLLFASVYVPVGTSFSLTMSVCCLVILCVPKSTSMYSVQMSISTSVVFWVGLSACLSAFCHRFAVLRVCLLFCIAMLVCWPVGRIVCHPSVSPSLSPSVRLSLCLSVSHCLSWWPLSQAHYWLKHKPRSKGGL